MSAAEIADNRWELSASKPPITTASGLFQILLMAGFALFFGWIIMASVVAIVTPNRGGGLAEQYKNLNVEQAAAPAEAAP
jgi:hypothetical protein